MVQWGPDGERAAKLSLWLDFGYMLTYGTWTALLLERVRCVHGHAPVVPAVVIPAVAADAIEGMSLLEVLKRTELHINARRARRAAIIKFALLGGALGYCVIGSINATRVARRT